MSEQTMTPESGSGEVGVKEAASRMLSLMEEPSDSPEQLEETEQEEVEAEDSEEYEESEEPEEEIEEVEESPRYRVKAAGEEKEVTIDELIKNYQLGADYTKKTTEVAEQRRALETEKAAIAEAKQLREQYAQRLQVLENFLNVPEEDIE